jgi:hypothetical protein
MAWEGPPLRSRTGDPRGLPARLSTSRRPGRHGQRHAAFLKCAPAAPGSRPLWGLCQLGPFPAVITPRLSSSAVGRALSTASSARGSGVPWASGGITAGCAPMIAGRAACRGGTVRLPRSRAMGVDLRADGGSVPCPETRRFRRLQRPCAPVVLSPPFAPLGVADVLLRWCHLSPGSCASCGVASLQIHKMSINYM